MRTAGPTARGALAGLVLALAAAPAAGAGSYVLVAPPTHEEAVKGFQAVLRILNPRTPEAERRAAREVQGARTMLRVLDFLAQQPSYEARLKMVGEMTVDARAPAARWHRGRAYPTAAECEAARAVKDAPTLSARLHAAGLPGDDFQLLMNVALLQASRCVEAAAGPPGRGAGSAR